MTVPISTNIHHGSVIGTDSSATAAFNKVSWGSVFAGFSIALAVQFLFNLLGVGLGAAVIDPATTDNPHASNFSMAGGVWFVIAGIIAAFVGVYTASRVSGSQSKSTGSYHGSTTWAVTTLVALYLLTTSVGAMIGGAFSDLSSIVGGIGQTAATAATAVPPAIANSASPMAGIEQQIRNTTGNDPQALQNAVAAAVQAALSGDQAKAEDAKARAADAISKAQGIPADQARAHVDQYEKTYRDNLETAKRQTADAA